VDPGWHFDINVYGWAPDIPVDIESNHGNTNLPEKLDKIVDSLQWGFMGEFRARRGPLGVYVAPIGLGLKDDEKFQGPIQEHKVSIEETVFIVDFGAFYQVGRWRLGEAPDSVAVTVEPFVGALWAHDNIKLNFSPGGNEHGQIRFLAPVVGLRMFWELTDRWDLRLSGNYGGFDVDNLEETYDMTGTVAYRFTMWGASSRLYVGYRYLNLHYDKRSDVELDVTAKGPLLGIGWSF
jgi:hypothetical protein